MTEKQLARIFGFGTAGFLVVLVAMSVDTMHKVTAGRTPPVTDSVAAGKAVWQRKNCNDCHTILGIGAYYAPDLTRVAGSRDDDWMTRWLTNPQATKPGTTMPGQRLTPEEVARLVAFFHWVHGIDTNNWPPQPAGPGAAGGTLAAGALLFQQKGCSGCHLVKGQGVPGVGPDLSIIGAQPYDALPNTPEFLAQWLRDPAAQKPGTTMPRLPLAADEVDELVEYLGSLK
jgi:nitric oxide reductase subunit C